MKVRMYCQGLGDCFLLSFPGGGRNIYILVDCGVFMGTASAKEMMEQIAQDIQQTTQGHLDAVVVTHEHWDHLSGFNQAKQIFDNMTIGEVWFAWTEKPDDEFALKLRKDREERANKLRLAVEQWQNAGLHPETSERVSSILDFFGAPVGVSNQLTTRDALNYLSARDDASKRYLEPG
ncbi:MAG: MBL fold metallo-hydrolase, partial [Candidatus Aminicenantes bacterium]|nr:MBL fold metallo-hydrolase [Candidatus Aminicenantes bacterium]